LLQDEKRAVSLSAQKGNRRASGDETDFFPRVAITARLITKYKDYRMDSDAHSAGISIAALIYI